MPHTRRSFLHTGAALLAAQNTGSAAPGDRITVGFIGAGARGQELIEAVRQHPRAEIVGLCDAYTGRIERSLDRTARRPRVYANHHDMLAQASIDAVVVATPDHLHAPIVLDALRAGKDVYCEKPLTYRSSEGLEIIRTARDRGRILQVGSQGVSGSLAAQARKIVRASWLGTVTTIRAFCNRNSAAGAWIYPVPPDASPKTVNWEMFLGSAPQRPFDLARFFRWRCYRDYSAGIAGDLFVHLATAIHYIVADDAPARVTAMGETYRWTTSRDVPDTLHAILEYPRGFVVNLSATFNNQNTPESSLHILGTEGTLKLDSAGLSYEPEEPLEDNRWVVDSWPKPLAEAYYKQPNVIQTQVTPASAEKMEREKAEEKEKEKEEEREKGEDKNPNDSERPHHYKADTADPTVAHFGHFFDSIRSRQPYWEDALAGHRAAACAHMINQSIAERRIVEWDPQKDDIR